MPKLELPYKALSLKKSRMYLLRVCWQALKSEKLFFFLSFMTTLIDLHVPGKRRVIRDSSREWWKFLKRQVWVICILSRYEHLTFYIKMKPPSNIIEQLVFLKKNYIFTMEQFEKVHFCLQKYCECYMAHNLDKIQMLYFFSELQNSFFTSIIS